MNEFRCELCNRDLTTQVERIVEAETDAVRSSLKSEADRIRAFYNLAEEISILRALLGKIPRVMNFLTRRNPVPMEVLDDVQTLLTKALSLSEDVRLRLCKEISAAAGK